MILTCSLLTHTDSAPPALALFTPALLTPLSAIRVCAEMKPVCPLKTIALLLQLLTQPAKICRYLPHFHLR